MILLLVIFLLLVGASATYFLPPEKRNLRIVASLIPVAALGILLAPFSIPDTFSISWLPKIFFPEPPLFRADLTSVSFSLYLCGLLIAIEWTRPVASKPRTKRAGDDLFTDDLGSNRIFLHQRTLDSHYLGLDRFFIFFGRPRVEPRGGN